jgi:hypothetical protein
MTARARAQDKPGAVLTAQAAKTRMEGKAMTDHHEGWVDVPDDTVRSAAAQADVTPVHPEVAGVDTNDTPATNLAHHVEVADINVESEGDVSLGRRDTFQASSQAVLNALEVSCCFPYHEPSPRLTRQNPAQPDLRFMESGPMIALTDFYFVRSRSALLPFEDR